VTEAARERSANIGRLKLVALIGAFAGPLLLATVWFALIDPQGEVDTRNNGQLIEPAWPLEDFSLRLADGGAFGLDELRGHWTLVYFAGGDCAEQCVQNLYHMRQVRLSLHKRMHRVQRLYIGAPLGDELAGEHPGLLLADGPQGGDDAGELRGQFDAAEAQLGPLPQAIYLVDPLGNLMMRFDPALDPRKMLKDLKHLLRVSRIG